MKNLSKVAKGLIAAAVVLIVAGGAGAWYFLRDTSPAPASLDAIAPAGASDGDPNGTASESPDGTWAIEAGDTVFVGYRVPEVLLGVDVTATGRTTGVTGEMTVTDGQVTAATITGDLTKLTRDRPNRDNAIRARGLETATYPDATFTLTEPIDLQDAQEGTEVELTATGEITLHGVTKAAEIPLQAKWSGNAITVATVGDGFPILMTDYGMEALEFPDGRMKEGAERVGSCLVRLADPLGQRS